MKKKGKKSGENADKSRSPMHEAHLDLEKSKQTIRELLLLRRSIYSGDPNKLAKIKEYRERAIEALNNLFDDEIRNAG